ncbi:hypothetical protein GGR56DRAFT_323742 [Xylariaceae sp. FL0804]|nr:hypothetical protein GGR56DRAFT_323742 [Xylariaceae sp. FL0804]
MVLFFFFSTFFFPRCSLVPSSFLAVVMVVSLFIDSPLQNQTRGVPRYYWYTGTATATCSSREAEIPRRLQLSTMKRSLDPWIACRVGRDARDCKPAAAPVGKVM